MTPKELAARHPKLYHVTEPDIVASVETHGLLSTSHILNLMGEDERLERRPGPVPLAHSDYGKMVLNDHKPLNEKLLSACLDDGLTVADWIAILNERVFFWPNEKLTNNFLGARSSQGRSSDVLVFDTLGLARDCVERMSICPFNSGATRQSVPRRGHSTFTALGSMSYRKWQCLRREKGVIKGRDIIKEVTVMGSVPDAGAHLVEVIRHRP